MKLKKVEWWVYSIKVNKVCPNVNVACYYCFATSLGSGADKPTQLKPTQANPTQPNPKPNTQTQAQAKRVQLIPNPVYCGH